MFASSSRATRALVVPALAVAGTAAVASSTSSSFDESDLAVAAYRFGVATTHFVPMYAVDYRAHRARVREMGGAGADEDARRASRHVMWRRVAERFRDCARALGGIYVKAGQHVCAQPIAPRPFQIVLRELMDDGGRRPFEEDARTFREEVGSSVDECFAEFDKEPIASASLAQVYRAKTLAGEEVAVKIQQRPVARFLESDLWTIEGYYSLMEYLVPGLRFKWLASETRRHMGEELDFTSEAENALRATKMLASDFDESELRIPRVHRHLSGKRVLTMEMCEGTRIDDVDALERQGVDLSVLAERIQKIFARMTFVHGFVHADPHPGNILVDKNGGIVLLDHGVYRALDDDLRAKWAHLWLALIRSDDEGLRKATKALGMDPEMSQFFKLILAVVPTRVLEEPNKKSKQRANASDTFTVAEKRAVLKKIMGVRLEDQSRLFETIPRDLLLVLKANNLLRYINEQLGSPINRYPIIWKAANEGLAKIERSKRASTVGGDESQTTKRGILARTRESFGDTIALFVLPIQLMALKGKLAFAFWQAKGKATAVAAAAAKTPPLVPPPM